jgi:uncharacterized protein
VHSLVVNTGDVGPVELTRIECVRLLATNSVGRLCVVEAGCPIALPVNYRLVFADEDDPVIVIRVRSGGVLDQPDTAVGFEIDGTDRITETGWSVLARGTLRDGFVDAAPPWLHYWNPRPWVGSRDQWLYLPVERVTGRQLIVPSAETSVRVSGYL